jgi:pimeloyl-ACP methyl ester carboxylesterase
MASQFLLIPGTGGVDFRFEDGSPSGYAFAILQSGIGLSDDIRQEIGCGPPGPDLAPWTPGPTTLRPGVKLFPNRVLIGTAYQAVPGKYQPYPYDWRLDIRYNGALLLEHLRRHAGAGRFRIITHSQGGLVLLAASRLCADPGEFARYVEKIVMVACPLIGTIRATAAVLEGDTFGGFAAPMFKEVSQTWPAIFQMFPQYACVEGRPALRPLDPALWQGRPLPVLELVKRGASFTTWLGEHPFDHMDGDIHIRFVFGNPSRTDTPIGLSMAADGSLRVSDHAVAGDGLVPYRETSARLIAMGLGDHIDTVTGQTVRDHSSLLNDPRVGGICDSYLSS